jgi:Fe-S-cluster containining protein
MLTKEEVKEARAIASSFKGYKPDERTLGMLRNLNAKHKCEQCGKCCKGMTIGMTGPEAVEIARFLGMKGSEFRKKYIDRQIGRWLIIKNIDNVCPFLEIEMESDEANEKSYPIGASCNIHDVRPTVCRNYPFLTLATIQASKYPKVVTLPGMCPNMKETIQEANKGMVR